MGKGHGGNHTPKIMNKKLVSGESLFTFCSVLLQTVKYFLFLANLWLLFGQANLWVLKCGIVMLG